MQILAILILIVLGIGVLAVLWRPLAELLFAAGLGLSVIVFSGSFIIFLISLIGLAAGSKEVGFYYAFFVSLGVIILGIGIIVLGDVWGKSK